MNWIELLKLGEWEIAEEKYLGHFGGEVSREHDYHRLVFIQGVLNTGSEDVALRYMEKYEPLFLDNEHKGLLLGWMARSLWKRGNIFDGKAYGQKALKSYDGYYGKISTKINGCISFSLFGNNPKYCETLMLNIEVAPNIYPDYKLLVYHDDSVPVAVLKRLHSFSYVSLVHINTIDASKYPGSFWRFLALEDMRFDVVLMRDADSIINDRDRTLVNVWLSSSKRERFHIVREWYTHTDLILAGMWGVRDRSLVGIRGMMDSYIESAHALSNKHADQWFLAEKVWPLLKTSMVHHDSVFDSPGSDWPKELSRSIDPRDRVGGMDMQIFQVDGIPDGVNYEIFISEGVNLVCSYRFNGSQKSFELPMEYQRRLQSGRYELKIRRLIKVSLRDKHGGLQETEVPM